MPQDQAGSPFLDGDPIVHNLYFLLPPGSSNFNSGPYTPRIVVPRKCLTRTFRSMIINALPAYPQGHSIEFLSAHIPTPPKGWYVSEESLDWQHTTATLMEWQSNQEASVTYSVVVSVKVLDEAEGCMVPIDPCPAPTCPPQIITWSQLCA